MEFGRQRGCVVEPIAFVVKIFGVVVVSGFAVELTLCVITGNLVVRRDSVLNGLNVGFCVFDCPYDLQRSSNEPERRKIS